MAYLGYDFYVFKVKKEHFNFAETKELSFSSILYYKDCMFQKTVLQYISSVAKPVLPKFFCSECAFKYLTKGHRYIV